MNPLLLVSLKKKRRLIVLKGVDVVLNLFYFLFLFNLNNSY